MSVLWAVAGVGAAGASAASLADPELELVSLGERATGGGCPRRDVASAAMVEHASAAPAVAVAEVFEVYTWVHRSFPGILPRKPRVRTYPEGRGAEGLSCAI